jgi:glycosyltransferase involved in cell wall biosynthesis
MKILLTIHHYLDKNLGAPGVTWNLGQEYQAQGHEVSYFSFDQLPANLPEKVGSLLFPLFVAIHIMKRLRDDALDVVVASTGDAWLWGKLGHLFGRRMPLLVTQSHGLEHMLHLQRLEDARQGKLKLSWKYPLYHGGFRLWEVSESLRSADICFFLNANDTDYAINQLDVVTTSALVIPNGLPNYLLGLPIEDGMFETDDRIRIVQVGRYTPEKGTEYSKAALNHILKKYDNVSVSFLGTCCESELVLKDFDESLHHQIDVVARYTHEELPKLLMGCDIKLFPTLSEGFGLALLEAMACGLAPVTTLTPGPREIVTDGYDGILIPLRDSRAIEDSLEKLIEDRICLMNLRKNAYATAQKYSWSEIAQRRLAIYQNYVDFGEDAQRDNSNLLLGISVCRK